MKYPILCISLLTGLFAANISSVNAQDERDALRLSQIQPQGTARSIGIGSALGSVGGDFSSLSVNPAGIGIYRSSEFTLTPSLTFSNTSSGYTGNSATETGSHFALSNIGIVTTTQFKGRRKRYSGGWTSVSFGVGLTRLADFTRDYSYAGRNTTSSGSFVFEADANSNGLSKDYLNGGQVESQGDLGYASYLLDTMGSGFVSVVNPTASSPVSQSVVVHERGGISELGMTLGGAYQEKLMLGATLGIPIVRYLRDKVYEEHDLSGNTNNDFDYFRYTDDLKTTGTGVNLKLGVIYKVSDYFRFGAAVHTPTYYSLHDVTNRSISANTESFGGDASVTAAENDYDYNIVSPWRGILSATGLFGQSGFFTVDYEYVDYSSSSVQFGNSQSEQDYQSYVNNTIKGIYKGASNVRAGLELRFGTIALRGGFGYYGNPYKSTSSAMQSASAYLPNGYTAPDGTRLSFSGGLGFRFQRAFLDLAFVHNDWKSNEQPYGLPNIGAYSALVVPTATLNTGANTAVLTVGFKM